MPHDIDHALTRIDALRRDNQGQIQDRTRIKQIMDGGVDGIHAVMAWDLGAQRHSRTDIAKAYGVDLPAVNLMASGMERLAQMVGQEPALKAPYAEDRDDRVEAEERMRIIRGWDDTQALELDYPQIGRWLPGYGQIAWVLTQRRHAGEPYPAVELRDSYDVYTGAYPSGSQPVDMLIRRVTPLYALKHAYPDMDWDGIEAKIKKMRPNSGVVDLGARSDSSGRVSGWEGPKTGIEVCEYYDESGCSYLIPEVGLKLGWYENPLDSGPAFVVARKYSFNRNVSQYHHIVGLMAMMAKLNMLALIVSEDGSFKETNIFGELESGTYERGRFAVNLLTRESRVEKPTGDLPQTVWGQIDRLERQLRIGAAYDVASDGQSPNSFATGQGIRELRSAAERNVEEYLKIIRWATKRTDSKRLEWAEKLWPTRKTVVFGAPRKNATYTPKKDIAGEYTTRRVHGPMATWDDPMKANVGLQYLGAGAFDLETIQEGIPGLTDAELVNQRNRARRAEETLFARLASAPPGEGFAPGPIDAALVEIMENPEDQRDILAKWFTPQEPELSPEEEEFAEPGLAGPGAGGPPPNFAEMLASLETGGEPGAETSRSRARSTVELPL